MPTKRKRLTVNVDPSINKLVTDYCNATGVSFSSYVNQLLIDDVQYMVEVVAEIGDSKKQDDISNAIFKAKYGESLLNRMKESKD